MVMDVHVLMVIALAPVNRYALASMLSGRFIPEYMPFLAMFYERTQDDVIHKGIKDNERYFEWKDYAPSGLNSILYVSRSFEQVF